jgi:hypothetical protein
VSPTAAARARRALVRATLVALALAVPLVCTQLVLAQVGVNAPPSASFTAAPNPVRVGEAVSFDASESADTGGTITKYEWDLDGNGSF